MLIVLCMCIYANSRYLFVTSYINIYLMFDCVLPLTSLVFFYNKKTTNGLLSLVPIKETSMPAASVDENNPMFPSRKSDRCPWPSISIYTMLHLHS